MNLEEFLRLHDAALDRVVEEVEAAIAFEAGDRLVAVGSLVEDLGNLKSDVDLLLITSGGRHANVSPDEVRSFVVGRCVIDLRIVPVAQLKILRARLRDWAEQPWAVSLPADFSPGELLMLHRLSAAQLLWPNVDPTADDASLLRNDVARLKLHVARHLARTVQVDMAGYRDENDTVSLVFAAQDLLGHAVDGLLAGYRLTNPTPKWRSRLLERLPRDWDSRLLLRPSGLGPRDFMWRLHRAPAGTDGPAALEHACRVATFARAAFLWAEETLVHGGQSRRYVWSDCVDPQPDAVLPFLDIDIDLMRIDGGIAIARLNDRGETLRMEFEAFALVLLFDNVTTAREAACVVENQRQSVPVDVVKQVAQELRRMRFNLSASSRALEHVPPKWIPVGERDML